MKLEFDSADTSTTNSLVSKFPGGNAREEYFAWYSKYLNDNSKLANEAHERMVKFHEFKTSRAAREKISEPNVRSLFKVCKRKPKYRNGRMKVTNGKGSYTLRALSLA